jgi:hypothetical protein
MPFEYVRDEDATVAGERVLGAHGPGAVLTGLVGDKHNLDYSLIRAARRSGVPVLSILDSWMNYSDRLRDRPGGTLSPDITPDRIAVMDESALADMVAEGVPAPLCKVTGHPKFDVLPEPRGPTPSFRGRFGIAPEETVVTFFSHSTAQFYSKEQLGYVESDAIQILFAGVRMLMHETPIFLLFKEHPRAPTRGLDLLEPPPRFQWLDESDADELMVCSDIVASMASTMLVFAAGLGIPVISIQPNLRPGEDRCVLTRRGLLAPAGTVEEFAARFRDAVFGIRRGSRGQVPTWRLQGISASGRVADIVDTLLK